MAPVATAPGHTTVRSRRAPAATTRAGADDDVGTDRRARFDDGAGFDTTGRDDPRAPVDRRARIDADERPGRGTQQRRIAQQRQVARQVALGRRVLGEVARVRDRRDRLAREQRRDVRVADHVRHHRLQAIEQRRVQHVDAGEHPLRHRALGRPRRARIEDARRPGRPRRRRWRPTGAAPDRRGAAWWRRRPRRRARPAAQPGRDQPRPWRSSPAPVPRRTAVALSRCRRPSRAARSRPSRRSQWPGFHPPLTTRSPRTAWTMSPRWNTLTTARRAPARAAACSPKRMAG